jgi:hypothetical protein
MADKSVPVLNPPTETETRSAESGTGSDSRLFESGRARAWLHSWDQAMTARAWGDPGPEDTGKATLDELEARRDELSEYLKAL